MEKLEKLVPRLIATLLEKTLFDYLFCIRQDFKSLFTLAVRNISIARHRKVFCNRWVKIHIYIFFDKLSRQWHYALLSDVNSNPYLKTWQLPRERMDEQMMCL